MLVQSLRDAPLPGCEGFSFPELCVEYAYVFEREDETCVTTPTCALCTMHAVSKGRPVIVGTYKFDIGAQDIPLPELRQLSGGWSYR